jgi:endothelin-converting enzyme/putative endopeptidase
VNADLQSFCAVLGRDERTILRDSDRMRRTLLVPVLPLLAALLVGACGGETPPPASVAFSVTPSTAPGPSAASAARYDSNLKGPDESALDRAVSPCDDFYQFACGGWMKATPIPDDQASWTRSFSVIHEENQKALRDILERDARGQAPQDPYSQELGDFWSSCMDEATIERKSLDDLRPELKRIDAVVNSTMLIKEIAHLHLYGVGAAFSFDSEVDMKDAAHLIAGLSQGGLGLPDRDYYLHDDQRTVDIRTQYERHIARTLQLLGENAQTSEADAKTVTKLETELASASMTKIDLRDPQKVYHRLDLEGLNKVAPDLPWSVYLEGLGFPAITAINVAQPEFVKKVNALSANVPIAEWRTYLRWHLAADMAPLLSQRFVDEWFHFRQVLTGTKTLQPRWKRCVRLVDAAMGEALARPFVAEHLGEDGKVAAAQMVAGIEQEMKSDLDGSPWMDDATRQKAEAKLGKILNKIGYPARWRSYEGLAIVRGAFVRNVEAATAFEVRRKLAKVGKPVDKDEWDMTPPTVNAYYDPTMNQMVFPAGILQAPFYAKTQTPPLNFGAIGMVVGHELTHGFDDEGRQFDADGNLRDWWTPAVSAEFDRRAACIEKQFDDYVPLDDIHIKGKLTLGENIADLGGLRLSFAAFHRSGNAHDEPPSTGFTPDQQFFLGFAQAWCSNYRPEALRLLLATNPHSPAKYRVVGPLANLSTFANAFQCKAGAPMVRAQHCEIW